MRSSRNRNKGLTRVDVIVLIIGVVFLLFIFFTANPFSRVRITPRRIICGTNLKGLGTAITVYGNDYDDNYPQLQGNGPWSKELGFDYDMQKPDFDGQQSETGRTITASWYLLVKEVDVSPKSFVCPNSKAEKEYNGVNPRNLDIVDLWDFGPNPHGHVSYVMHNPYGKFPGHGARNGAIAVAADMNPWMKSGDFVSKPNKYNCPQIIKVDEVETYNFGNSLYHPEWRRFFGRQWDIKGTAESQNVLYADGHTANEKQPNCGVRNDNIYTYWSAEENPTDQDIQGGTAPTGRDAANDAKSEDDSFLVL